MVFIHSAPKAATDRVIRLAESPTDNRTPRKKKKSTVTLPMKAAMGPAPYIAFSGVQMRNPRICDPGTPFRRRGIHGPHMPVPPSLIEALTLLSDALDKPITN